MGIFKRIFAFDAFIDTEGIENRDKWKFEAYEEFEADNQIGSRGVFRSTWWYSILFI